VCFFNEIYWILVLLFVLIDHDAVFLLFFSWCFGLFEIWVVLMKRIWLSGRIFSYR
jgi:hypothetical protein